MFYFWKLLISGFFDSLDLFAQIACVSVRYRRILIDTIRIIQLIAEKLLLTFWRIFNFYFLSFVTLGHIAFKRLSCGSILYEVNQKMAKRKAIKLKDTVAEESKEKERKKAEKQEKDRLRQEQYRSRKVAGLAMNPTVQPNLSEVKGEQLKPIMDLVDKCCRLKDASDWCNVLQKKLRVVHVLHVVFNNSKCKALKTTHRRPVLAIKPAEETESRKYKIQILDGEHTWLDLFEVRPSTIENAGLGLFALRDYANGSLLGMYAGKVVRRPSQTRPLKLSAAQIAYSMKLTDDVIVLQQGVMGGRCGGPNQIPTFFGFHFCNDPCYVEPSTGRQMRQLRSRSCNTIVSDDNLKVFATADIQKGDELFFNYNRGEEED